MPFRLLAALAALLTTFSVHAQDAPGLDERINTAFTPVADAISALIFYSVPVNGAQFPLIVGWLIFAGLVFTLYFRFINIRAFGHAYQLLRGRYDNKNSPGEVTYFQALSSAVSGTVGLGNIAGVAVAITIGGPGAVFWMIVAGLLGMTTKFVECTLGTKYRLVKADGTVSGGPMYYLTRGIKEQYPKLGGVGWVLAIIFAICAMLGAIGAGAMFQANQAYAQLANVTGGADGFFGDKAWLFGLVYAGIAGAVVIGGISRIGAVTAKLVPTMAAIYILACLVVLGFNVGAIPSAIGTIVSGAFSAEGVTGGIIGALIQGFRRAAFSNEAGLGSSAIAHSTIKTREPASAGLVALWEPFVDTVVICSMTAMVIVITGVYMTGEGVEGVQLTSAAFATVMPWFPYLLAFLVLLFAFSTTITWGYYGAKAASFLARESKGVLYGFKFFYLVMVVVGCTMSLGAIVDLADGLLFLMAIPNLIGLYLLAPVVKREVKGYFERVKSGEFETKASRGPDA
ncbi:alanine/glycine:cation symporter family protein [Alkalisalibacterium limincola]|uniref:Alanine:cation symporter family protein n=1 Tax=Alkalisalibacterium limincola TaxID=2699169 RepID=A0A5C8KQW0_9GAMM|nr:alanine/glycine:cation symporter family protein [Alkalisalibacterium limincola]TXK62529.1 alanine:cation symporter family protein [Alkalisalibacterium limincola]